MHTVKLSRKARWVGPPSAGTVEIISVLQRHLDLLLVEAKEYVDRCLVEGEVVTIPVEDHAAAQRLVAALDQLRDAPPLSATVEGPHEIRFYAVADDHGSFSNFAPYPIVIGKQQWSTTEHYFQAQKFANPADQEQVRKAKTPGIAARLGRSRKKKLRRDWETARVDVMRVALRAKFEQHPDLRALLLSTGDAQLIEHTDRDAFWGDGGDGSGHNMLGRLLMELRGRLSEG